MHLTLGQLLPRSLCGATFCAYLALMCPGYGQSYYGAGYQPIKTKPFESNLAGHGQPSYMHPTRDLYNKYFYTSPSVSPYLNLDRPAIGGTTAYHTWVRPEQQRRQQHVQRQSAHIATRKQQTSYSPMSYGAGRPTLGATPKPRPNAYYNQWYGRR